MRLCCDCAAPHPHTEAAGWCALLQAVKCTPSAPAARGKRKLPKVGGARGRAVWGGCGDSSSSSGGLLGISTAGVPRFAQCTGALALPMQQLHAALGSALLLQSDSKPRVLVLTAKRRSKKRGFKGTLHVAKLAQGKYQVGGVADSGVAPAGRQWL